MEYTPVNTNKNVYLYYKKLCINSLFFSKTISILIIKVTIKFNFKRI